ncbi:MAG: hypothetical protein EOO29_33965 [Comamonadaceae bacterium]|nr:MAG: hypothetical protein EOO29_33965 [Comamonadaceae bacterium]
MKKTLSISAARLPAGLRARFLAMLEAASGRGIVDWKLADGMAADVVLVERQAPAGSQAITICLGDAPAMQAMNSLRLQTGFSPGALMDVLDLAALRVMDVHTEEARAAVAMPVQPEARYRLKHWVFLGGSCATPQHKRVLATMSRQAVSRQWMLHSGGLSEAQADFLLAELQLRGALTRDTSGKVAHANARGTSASRGLMARFLRACIRPRSRASS